MCPERDDLTSEEPTPIIDWDTAREALLAVLRGDCTPDMEASARAIASLYGDQLINPLLRSTLEKGGHIRSTPLPKGANTPPNFKVIASNVNSCDDCKHMHTVLTPVDMLKLGYEYTAVRTIKCHVIDCDCMEYISPGTFTARMSINVDADKDTTGTTDG